MLRDVSDINMKTTIMGNEIDFPIGIAPTAMQRMAHDEGELATARGGHAYHSYAYVRSYIIIYVVTYVCVVSRQKFTVKYFAYNKH